MCSPRGRREPLRPRLSSLRDVTGGTTLVIGWFPGNARVKLLSSFRVLVRLQASKVFSVRSLTKYL